MTSLKQAGWAAALALGLSAHGADHGWAGDKARAYDHSKTDPRLEACIKSVNAIGASMGHTKRTGAEAKPILDFVVRSNGLDYRVACEIETGLLRDVTPYVQNIGVLN